MYSAKCAEVLQTDVDVWQEILNRVIHLKLNWQKLSIIGNHKNECVQKTRPMVRVAQLPHCRELGLPAPISPGYRNIMLVETNLAKLKRFLADTETIDGLGLDPASLKDSRGRSLINLWGFSLVYNRVAAIDSKEGWCWPGSEHWNGAELTYDYWDWRKAGSNYEQPIRYPNGHRSSPWVMMLWPVQWIQYPEKIDSAWNLYNMPRELVKIAPNQILTAVLVPSYRYLVSQNPVYRHLLQHLKDGGRLQLLSRDAPVPIKRPSGDFYSVFRINPGLPGQPYASSMEITTNTKYQLAQVNGWIPNWPYVLAICLIEDALDFRGYSGTRG